MSYQPTPETERIKGALHTNWNDLMNHARKLERERDEARKETEYYKKRYEQLKDGREMSDRKWYNGREIPADIK